MNTRRGFFTRAVALLGIGAAGQAQDITGATGIVAVPEDFVEAEKERVNRDLVDLVKAITESPEAMKILKGALQHTHSVMDLIH